METEGQEQVKDVANILQTTIDTVNGLHSQLHGGEGKQREGDLYYSKEEYWKKLVAVAKLLSHECTKLSLTYSKTPYPDNSSLPPLLGGIEAALVTMVSAFYGLPKTHGLTLRSQTHKTLLFILECVHALLCDIKSLSHSEPGEKRLRSTGTVWEACERVNRLPKDNQQAALYAVKREMGLVVDALDELQEEIQSHTSRVEQPDVDNAELWSCKDKELLPSCLGLVKTAKALLRKIEAAVQQHGKTDTEQAIAQLDDVAELVKSVSPAVDDFVLSTYAPVRKDNLKQQTEELSKELKLLLEKLEATHITQESDQKWIQFLYTAIDHNKTKLTELLDNVHD